MEYWMNFFSCCLNAKVLSSVKLFSLTHTRAHIHTHMHSHTRSSLRWKSFIKQGWGSRSTETRSGAILRMAEGPLNFWDKTTRIFWGGDSSKIVIVVYIGVFFNNGCFHTIWNNYFKLSYFYWCSTDVICIPKSSTWSRYKCSMGGAYFLIASHSYLKFWTRKMDDFGAAIA